MLLITSFSKCVGQPYSRTPYSVLHTDRPSSTEDDILSAEEETPEQLQARFHLMSDDIGDKFGLVMHNGNS